VKVVLDACIPRPLRDEIAGHEVVTSHYLGLSRLEDADLLDAIEADFDALVTCDRSIPWQNQFAGRKIAVLVLRAPTNKLEDLIELVPALLDALAEVKPGEVREISFR
jgi:hypothetical protein